MRQRASHQEIVTRAIQRETSARAIKDMIDAHVNARSDMHDARKDMMDARVETLVEVGLRQERSMNISPLAAHYGCTGRRTGAYHTTYDPSCLVEWLSR